MTTYFTLLTPTGLAKIANAQLTQNTVAINQVAVGDSNGVNYTPTGNETALKKERWRGGVASVNIDTTNPNWIVVEAVIPSSVGGFTLREVALYDVDGDMIAIGNYPDTYKPLASDGSTMDLVLRTIIEVSNASSITLRIDPNVIVASRKYVDDKVGQVQTALTEHSAEMASLSQVGHVQLSSEMNSNDETKAVTPKTVKLLNESKANTKQENWINLPELNGWSASAVAADKPRFFKDNFGIVHVYGTFKKNNSGSVHFTTLPVGYRPGFTSSYPLKVAAKTSTGVLVVSEVTIENDGSLYCFTNGATEVYLDFSFVPN